jgi:hypothetical protein
LIKLFFFALGVGYVEFYNIFETSNKRTNTDMTTLESTAVRKVKAIEVSFSNMTFIVQAQSHYMAALNNPNWSTNRYTATIKETGEGIGMMGGRKLIKSQMELINSKPHLFLK